ncbi:nuclear transport factor 2 family protein [uncultured Roseobacter sp.]|uniref:nuclear transport factor 2 family protein n=1 Tax=uncultured Roseobacter sp. TaxID=114847 RepID=UPI002627BE98|nr:nuclear transport factor 2 family protein [uncultured Roseobacter sp.]
MSDTDVQAFARAWQAGWNSHDLDRILAHYSDDVLFHSLKARAVTGSGEICGKAALRAYWAQALVAQPDLLFTVEDVFAGHEMMVITYRNHHRVLAAETLYFGLDGLVNRAAACHAE